jgi:hypothetical protein
MLRAPWCLLWLSSVKFARLVHFHGKKSEILRSLIEMGLSLRWLIACLLFALAAGVMVFNKMTVCSWMRRKNPAATISVIGGILGAVACEASPSAWVNHLWWAPTALDIIGAPYLLILMWAGVREIMTAEERP